MAWDFDTKMLIYLAIITAGIFIIPMGTETDHTYYLIVGLILIAAGIILVYQKIKKK